MSKSIAAFAAALLTFCVACQVPDQHQSASAISQKKAVDSRMEELKYSQFCSEAAGKFWSRHDWKDEHDLQFSSYTSHYSKTMNKCLVDVHSVTLSKEKALESDHVYDALEGAVLGGRVLVRKAGAEGDIESVLFVKDGRTIRDKQEVASFVPWFQSLMTE